MRKHSACATLLAFLTVGICLSLAIAAGIAWLLPGRAAQAFGAPAANLQGTQRIFYALQLIRFEDDLLLPADPAGQPRPFKVEFGEATATIIQRLYQEGFVSNPNAFRIYLQYRGLDTSLQAGEYMISASHTPIQIAQMLQDATPTHIRFGVLPGWRLEEIAAALPSSGLAFAPDDFLYAAHQAASRTVLSFPLPPQASLEGLIFPDVYRLPRDINPDDFFQTALQNLDGKLNEEIRQGFDRLGLDVYQGIILASIIEREAIVDDEMPLISSVFHNRLAINMKLDSDPTVQYALGFNAAGNTWWTNPLSAQDLMINSPYNTYLYPGLPPGPIANPSLLAIQATAYPSSTPYYYFRAMCDNSGRHFFAETYEQHLQNACP